MVVPWIGFRYRISWPAGACAQRVAMLNWNAISLGGMRGTRSFTSIIDWPYREGLRLDEALHPLTLIAVGLYGKILPNQNGAPLRLVVPWKYGFRASNRLSRSM